MNDPVIDADADFSAMFGPEDLHPDLALYLNGMGSDMRALRHPLVYDVPYFERMNKQLNLRLRLKEERLAEAVANKEWIIAIYMHERPYRAQMLHEYVNEIDDPKLYWELVSAVWTESENIWQNLDNWTDLWSFYHLKDRHEVMDEDERAALEALPDRVTVYRGVTRYSRRNGLSWTLDQEKATWFANRFKRKSDKPCVLVGEIPKDEILAHFLGHNEHEIVANYKDVKNIRRK
jgi:hypothetical protein